MSHCSANLMEMIWSGGGGRRWRARGGGTGRSKKMEKKKKSLISVWVESTFLLLASPETIGGGSRG